MALFLFAILIFIPLQAMAIGHLHLVSNSMMNFC